MYYYDNRALVVNLSISLIKYYTGMSSTTQNVPKILSQKAC